MKLNSNQVLKFCIRYCYFLKGWKVKIQLNLTCTWFFSMLPVLGLVTGRWIIPGLMSPWEECNTEITFRDSLSMEVPTGPLPLGAVVQMGRRPRGHHAAHASRTPLLPVPLTPRLPWWSRVSATENEGSNHEEATDCSSWQTLLRKEARVPLPLKNSSSSVFIPAAAQGQQVPCFLPPR